MVDDPWDTLNQPIPGVPLKGHPFILYMDTHPVETGLSPNSRIHFPLKRYKCEGRGNRYRITGEEYLNII
jgi:hypothetical protein